MEAFGILGGEALPIHKCAVAAAQIGEQKITFGRTGKPRMAATDSHAVARIGTEINIGLDRLSGIAPSEDHLAANDDIQRFRFVLNFQAQAAMFRENIGSLGMKLYIRKVFKRTGIEQTG